MLDKQSVFWRYGHAPDETILKERYHEREYHRRARCIKPEDATQIFA
jgi:hypothetical protein